MNRKYRLGSKVFHVNKDLWLQCKENHVTDVDVMREYNRFSSAGILVKQETAIAAALRDKKMKYVKGGVHW